MVRDWLDGLEVATSCPFEWDAMEGRGSVRFFGGCRSAQAGDYVTAGAVLAEPIAPPEEPR